jgi:fucose 4-O-acetylase-like acetyltransferase
MPRKRDVSVDALRGVAVFTMIASNLAAEVMSGSHPLLLRLFGSFAAPFFITISGMMVY